MENINNASETPNRSLAFLNALTVELNQIRTVNEVILQKNADLLAQIAACEARQGYIRASLDEGERIAQEVTRNAEVRVENIWANAQILLVPQKEQIALVEQELTELSEEISLGASLKEEESGPKVTEIASIRRGFSLREPLFSDFCSDNRPTAHPEIISPGPGTVIRREFSIREPQAWDITEDIPVVSQPAPSTPELPSSVGREFSLREPQAWDIPEDIPVVSQPAPSTPELPSSVGREFSLREPQPWDIPEDIPVVSQPAPSTPELPSSAGREFSLREPQHLDITLENLEPKYLHPNDQQQQSALLQEYYLTEPVAEDISNYDLAMGFIEQNESQMHLDAFVDVRYIAGQGEQPGQRQKHSWQVKIDVEVPTDNREFIGYGKVSSAVTKTLLRYDDILLNDVFPFDIIQPNPENIAGYFYNTLEDTVSIMGLTIQKISVWDSQLLIKEVNRRNFEFDDLLRGDDILQDIRNRMFAGEQGDDKTAAGRGLGYIFKK